MASDPRSTGAGSGAPRSGHLPSGDPWAEWYDAYRRQRDGRDAADMALREGLRRQIGWMSWFIVVWTGLICAATAAVIWLLLC